MSQSVPEDLKSNGRGFVATAEWRGLFMVELLRDHSGVFGSSSSMAGLGEACRFLAARGLSIRHGT